MTTTNSKTQRIVQTHAILYWLKEARRPELCSPRFKYARDRAWQNALEIARLHPDWRVSQPAGHVESLVQLTRRGPRGGQWGRVHYKTRAPGREMTVS